jgi:hypothetical protein
LCPSSIADGVFRALAALHEDLERLERVIVKDYKQDARTHKEKLMQNHRVRKRLDQMQETARKLVGPCKGSALPAHKSVSSHPTSCCLLPCRFGCMRTEQRRATTEKRR